MPSRTQRISDELYETQVADMPLEERLHLAARILSDADERRGAPRSLLELEGLGAELWQGEDAQGRVDRLRSEWDDPA